MKKLIAVLGFGFLFATLAFNQAGDLEGIKAALKAGNATGLSKYIDGNVEIEIDGDVDYYEKGEAISKLKAFFASNKVKSFTQAHQGSTKDNSAKFLICHLSTASGAYRVYLLMKVSGKRYTLQEMNFSKE